MAAAQGNNYRGNSDQAKRALQRALAIRSGEKDPTEHVTEFQALVDIWDKQIDKALAGDIKDVDNQSAQMIIDRLDGKPRQAVDTTLSNPDGSNMSISFNGVESDGRRKDTD